MGALRPAVRRTHQGIRTLRLDAETSSAKSAQNGNLRAGAVETEKMRAVGTHGELRTCGAGACQTRLLSELDKKTNGG